MVPVYYRSVTVLALIDMHGLVNGVHESTGSFTTFMGTGEAMILNNFAYYRPLSPDPICLPQLSVQSGEVQRHIKNSVDDECQKHRVPV